MTSESSPPGSDLVLAVAELVESVPPGRVVTYGDIAAVLGTGPRQVASVMSKGVVAGPWWRVVRSDGTLPPQLWDRAGAHYEAEGTDVGNGRVRMSVARWGFAI